MTHSTHLYVPSSDEITAAAEPFIAAIAAESETTKDAGRLTDEMQAYFAGRLARIARAGELLAAGAVDFIDNAWQVDSQHKAPKWEPGADPVDAEDCDPYKVTADHCGCYDHRLHPDLPCKHQLAVKMYGRILSAQLDSAVNDTNSGLYAIEASAPGIYYVMDRITDVDICAAYHVTRTGTYRPETSHDAAAFARWLVAHPADYYPGGLLERLLRTAPGAKITLGADVYYGSIRTYHLSGYRFEGQPWVDLEYTQRQEFNPAAWEAVLAVTGWALTSRPVKMPGTQYNYLLERADGDQTRYMLTGACDQTVERERQARAFAAIEVERTGEVQL